MEDSMGLIIAVGLCAVFWYLFGSSGSDGGSTSAGGSAPRRRRNVPQAHIDQVTGMFPHVNPNSVRYELERTGNVQACVERILRDGGLPDAPAGFFGEPSSAPGAGTSATPSRLGTPATAASGGSSISRPSTPASLIQRMNLRDRVSPSPSLSGSDFSRPATPATADGKGKGKATGSAWEASPEKRETSLKERKARMVIEARRKLLEKEQAAAAGTGASTPLE